MNKAELITSISEKTNLTKKDSECVINAFVETVKEAMENGDKVALVGFGTFEAKSKPARECTNPMTGAKVKVAACKAPVLKFGKNFKDSIN